MNLRLLILAALCIVACRGLCSAQPGIEELMQRDDYISASLMVVAPGEASYAAGGHLTLRMRCPIQNVDYTYEFDAALNDDQSLLWLYITGRLKGEYVRLLTADFLAKAHKENRTVDEYQLNLTPEQEVALWAGADDAVDAPADLPFTPAEHNCCSMLLTLIESSTGIDFFSNTPLHGALRKYMPDVFYGSPWTGLMWNTLMGIDFDRDATPTSLLYPKIMGEQLYKANNPANGKPLTNCNTVSSAFSNAKHSTFTPTLAFALLLAFTCLLTATNAAGRLQRAARRFDWILVAVTTATGCVLWLAFFASLFGTRPYANALMALCTPLPIALALARKPALWLWWARAETAIAAITLASACFTWQMRIYGMWLPVAAILIRGLYYIHSNNPKTTTK